MKPVTSSEADMGQIVLYGIIAVLSTLGVLWVIENVSINSKPKKRK